MSSAVSSVSLLLDEQPILGVSKLEEVLTKISKQARFKRKLCEEVLSTEKSYGLSVYVYHYITNLLILLILIT